MAPARTPKQTAGPRRAGAPRSRPATPSARRSPSIPGRRKQAPQSNAKKVFGAVTTALPGLIEKAGTPAKKAKPSSRKGGAGLALVGAGAVAAALKNRSKLPGKLGGRSNDDAVQSYETVTPVPVTPVMPVTPVAPVTDVDGSTPS